MLPYAILLLFTIICLLLNKRVNRFFGVLPYVAMAVFSGLRYNVAVDYQNYVYVFNSIQQTGVYGMEPGYVWLVKVVQAIGGTQQLVFLMCASFNSAFMYLFLRKESPLFGLSTILYLCLGPFYLSTFNTMREGLAISIFLFGTTFLNKSTFKYLFFVVLAFLFHRSAIVFAFLPLAKNFFEKFGMAKTVFLTVVLIVIFKIGLLAVMDNYFSVHQFNTYNLTKITPIYFVFALLFSTFILLQKNGAISLKNYEVTMCSYTVSLIMSGIIIDSYGTIFARFISYGSFFFPLFICYLIEALDSRIKELAIFGAVAFSSIYYFFVLSTAEKMLPYQANVILLSNTGWNTIFIIFSLLVLAFLLLLSAENKKKRLQNKVFFGKTSRSIS